MSASVHPRTLRYIVQCILNADTPLNYDSIGDLVELSPRHLTNCFRVLIDQQKVIIRERDFTYSGYGIRYKYRVDLPLAVQLGYLPGTEKLRQSGDAAA